MKIIRITTVPISLYFLLKGQLKYLSNYFNVIAVSSPGDLLNKVAIRENVQGIGINIKREINIISDLVSLYKLYILFKKEKPDIVHSLTPKSSLLSMIAAWMAKVPHRYYSVTGLRFEGCTGLLRWTLINMERISCYFATKVIPEGNGVKEKLIKYSITNKPLEVILNGSINGIDLQYFSKNNYEKNLRDELNIEPNDTLFCFVGRLVGDKGINELIQSFHRLNNIHPNSKLLLVGPFEKDLDPLKNEIYDLINTNKSILHVGFQEDIRPYLNSSDIFVFPSYREGFPNVVLQAGAMDLPCIVTDINGSNEIIKNGINGLIIPPKDSDSLYNAMIELFLNKSIRLRMANAAREMIETRYEQQLIWQELLKEYQSIDKNV